MPPADADPAVLAASVIVNGQVLKDEQALRASLSDLTRKLRDEATSLGRYITSDVDTRVAALPRQPVPWWQVILRSAPPRLYRLTKQVRTEPLDDPLI